MRCLSLGADSIFYGNIGHFVQNLYSSGLRYRKRMDELSEFSRFHNLPPTLRTKIRNYVDFAFSVTKVGWASRVGAHHEHTFV